MGVVEGNFEFQRGLEIIGEPHDAIKYIQRYHDKLGHSKWKKGKVCPSAINS